MESLNKESKVFIHLRSDEFALILAVLSVLSLAPNTYYVFYTLSSLNSGWKEAQSVLVSTILGGAILYYTVKKNIEVAKQFAWFEFGISCCYYIMNVKKWGYLIPAFGFAAMLPASIYNYASEIGRKVVFSGTGKKRGAPIKNKNLKK